jgi:hypothetical protein
MLESYVNLKLLIDDPEHADQIVFENARQSLKVVRGFAGDAEVAADPSMMAQIVGYRQEHTPVYDELTARGLKKKPIFDLFTKAGEKQLYLAYRFLCTFSHNQLSTLVARHAGAGYLIMGQGLPVETLERILALSITRSEKRWNLHRDSPI